MHSLAINLHHHSKVTVNVELNSNFLLVGSVPRELLVGPDRAICSCCVGGLNPWVYGVSRELLIVWIVEVEPIELGRYG